MTMISWELQAPVWCALAPRTTMPSSRRSTTWTYMSGSGCWCGGSDAVALGVGHRAVHDQVVVLDVLDVLAEPLVVGGAVRLVDLEGDRDSALMASMPTQRWKHEPVFWPSRRCILTFLDQVGGRWWMCVNRLTFLPVRWLVASMRSSYSGWAPARRSWRCS